MPNATLDLILLVISLAGSVLTLGKLFITGLHRRYYIFFLYFIFRIPNSTWPLFFHGFTSPTYRRLWMVTEPIAWTFHILVVLELYRLILEQHRGIYTIGRWAMNISLAIAAVISIVTLLPNLRPGMRAFARLMTFELGAGRGIDLGLVVFILLMLVFLSRYPIRLSRNIVVHAALYSVFFLSTTFGLLLRVIFGNNLADRVDVAPAAVSSLCTIAWFFLLSPEGEKVEVNLSRSGPLREQYALKQLDALNATLLRSARN